MTDKMKAFLSPNRCSLAHQTAAQCRDITARVDPRQTIPYAPYTQPTAAQRRLIAELILEEALETVAALGFCVDVSDTPHVTTVHSAADVELLDTLGRPGGSDPVIDMEKVIDGCCDTIFVCHGALAGMGVPDEPHIVEVCRANLDKFPNGTPVLNPSTGKYLKPEGWRGPDHAGVKAKMARAWEDANRECCNSVIARDARVFRCSLDEGHTGDHEGGCGKWDRGIGS